MPAKEPEPESVAPYAQLSEKQAIDMLESKGGGWTSAVQDHYWWWRGHGYSPSAGGLPADVPRTATSRGRTSTGGGGSVGRNPLLLLPTEVLPQCVHRLPHPTGPPLRPS